MKKEEVRTITITYCDVCGEEIEGTHKSLSTKSLILDFHSGYESMPRCDEVWDDMDIEEKSDIIQKLKYKE